MYKKEMTEEEALRRLAADCARREHCRGQMRGRMRQWGMDEEAQQRVIDYLVAHKYVDDERFCRLFVKDKLKFNKWGRRKIEAALAAYGTDRATVQAALAEVTDDDYLEVLRPLLRAKDKSLRCADGYERRRKLMAFALGRGFDMHLVSRCLGSDDTCHDPDPDF